MSVADSNGRLEARLSRWKRDQKEIQVVTKRRETGGPVSLVEFGNTRTTFYHWANELEAILLGYLRASLENDRKELLQRGMPSQVALDEYVSRSTLATNETLSHFKRSIADLRAATDEHWDEYEHPFTQDEIDGFATKFQFLANQIQERSLSAFRTAARWDPAKSSQWPAAATGGSKGETERRIAVEAFILSVKKAGWPKVTRKDIWTVGGYKSRSDFERFERHDPRTTKAAIHNFERILSMQPEMFISSLKNKSATK